MHNFYYAHQYTPAYSCRASGLTCDQCAAALADELDRCKAFGEIRDRTLPFQSTGTMAHALFADVNESYDQGTPVLRAALPMTWEPIAACIIFDTSVGAKRHRP